MITVITSTTDRPDMLRTALRSVERQTAKDQIAEVIVSENGGAARSKAVCDEFPTLPIKYIFREPALAALDHGRALYTHPDELAGRYVAILHDDDWWGPHHIEDGLAAFENNPDAASYWATSFLVHGESSWYLQCWNESCWVAAGFPPIAEIAKLDRRQAALACVGSGPAHYSTLIARKEPLAEAFSVVADTGNLHDNDRLLFLELSRRGPLLVNFVPDVFVRQHPLQDQRQLTWKTSYEHVAAATHMVLNYCAEEGIDVRGEFMRRYRDCPIESYRSHLLGTFDPRVKLELERIGAYPMPELLHPKKDAKWFINQVCPPGIWKVGRRLNMVFSKALAVVAGNSLNLC